MKNVILLIALGLSLLSIGCGEPKPLPDPTTENKPVAPGTKTNDVLMPINK